MSDATWNDVLAASARLRRLEPRWRDWSEVERSARDLAVGMLAKLGDDA